MADVLVSIILPTYNRGKKIKDCIDSVIEQDYQNFELIISDDHSTDDTWKVLKKIKKTDRRIKINRNRVNKGLPGNRNVAISISKGEYLFFIEDDLVLEKDCVSRLVNDFSKLRKKGKKVGGIAPSYINECDDEEQFGMLNETFRSEKNKKDVPCKINPITGVHYYNFSPNFKKLQKVPDVHACSFYDRKAVESVGGYDPKTFRGNFLYEETDLNTRISKKGYVFYFDPKVVLHHRPDISGGCRVKTARYNYYYLLNHIKYVIKNFTIKAPIMVPAFVIYIFCYGLRAYLLRTIRK